MKKIIAALLAVALMLSVAGCGTGQSFDIKIVVPAGSRAEFVYSDTQLSPAGSQIAVTAGEGLGETSVVLRPVEADGTRVYEPTYLMPGMTVKLNAQKGAWFDIGVSLQNPTASDVVVVLNVSNVIVRIE